MTSDRETASARFILNECFACWHIYKQYYDKLYKQNCLSNLHLALTPHHSIFTGRMPFLTPKQQCQSTEGTTIKNVSKTFLKVGKNVKNVTKILKNTQKTFLHRCSGPSLTVMPNSHRPPDTTRQSCLCRVRCVGVNWTIDPNAFRLQVFCRRQSWVAGNPIHTAEANVR